MAAGGVLRVHNVGPDEVSAEPPDKVSTVYEAGVVDCRMLRPGSVTVTITRTGSTATIEVVVVE